MKENDILDIQIENIIETLKRDKDRIKKLASDSKCIDIWISIDVNGTAEIKYEITKPAKPDSSVTSSAKRLLYSKSVSEGASLVRKLHIGKGGDK